MYSWIMKVVGLLPNKLMYIIMKSKANLFQRWDTIQLLDQQFLSKFMNFVLRASVNVNRPLNGLFLVMPSSENFKNTHQQMFLI